MKNLLLISRRNNFSEERGLGDIYLKQETSISQEREGTHELK